MPGISNLGIVTSMMVSRLDGCSTVHFSFGRVIDRLAKRSNCVYLSTPVTDVEGEGKDYLLQASNVEVVPQPYYESSMGALRHVAGIVKSYYRVCRKSDVLFIRGMVPYVFILYAFAFLFQKRTCHWIVGDPIALLKTHKRANRIVDLCSLLYAYFDRMCTRIGRKMTRGSFICNGQALADVYPSSRTHVTVSSTITDEEFHEREDTCRGPAIKVLYIGFIRPEKGIEYLIEAFAMLPPGYSAELVIVGSWDQFQGYKARLGRMIEEHHIQERVSWEGYKTYGEEMARYFREADLFVLPTLSEGTPRVLVEARANSLPVVATNVGGIPTSVTDGVDGLLVPPKDSVALSSAINRVISDGELRRSLICNGIQSARRLTVDRFVDRVVDMLEAEHRDKAN